MFAIPSAKDAFEKVRMCHEGGLKSRRSLAKLSQRNLRKVLTEKIQTVSLELFPSLGSGSLKFTLCD